MVASTHDPKGTRRLVLLIGLLVGCVALGLALSHGPLRSVIPAEWMIQQLKSYGAQFGLVPALMIFAAASVLAVPLSILTPVYIVALGPVQGMVCALCGGFLASALSFSIGRGLGHVAVQRLAGQRFDLVSQRLQRRGILAAFLVRLVPAAPFAVVNMVAGATPIRMRDFLIGSTLGLIPATAVIAVFVDTMVAALLT